MTPLKIAVADDVKEMRDVLGMIIDKSGGYELVGEASDGEEMLDLFERTKPEVIILDVEMPNMDGLKCAKAIQDIAPKTVLVFATAHDQYMREAFELYAFDYLMKPYRVDRALKTLDLIKSRLNAPEPEPQPPRAKAAELGAPSRIMLKHREGVNFVDLDEILLVQREDRMTVVYAQGDKRFITGESMGELEGRLPDEQFFRCHKSYIININHIDSISPYGRWTFIVKMRGTKQDALITHERFEAMQKMFK